MLSQSSLLKLLHLSFLIVNNSANSTEHMMKIANTATKQLANSNIPNPHSPTVIITNIEHKQIQNSLRQDTESSIHIDLIVQNALQSILFKVKQQIFENNCINTKMTRYGGKFSQQYVKQTVRMELDHNHMELPFLDDNQPNALRSDNLIPVDTNIETNDLDRLSKKQSVQQTTLGKFPRNSTIVSRSQKQIPIIPPSDPKNTTKTSSYIKLNEQDIPQYQVSTQPFVQEMRRQKEAKLKESQQNKKSQKKTNLRDIIKKDEKISYDFTGEIIKIKQNQKGNFVANSVEGIQNAALSKRQKQPKIDSNTINLDINSRRINDRKALSKKAVDIQFSNIVSLTPQLQILQGVKFIHGKSVLQKKKKQPSISELKKTISTKRFTRNDFERLKSLGDSKSVRAKGESPSLPSIIKSQIDISDKNDKNESILGRPMSEAKFEERSRFSTRKTFLDKSLDRMSIQNQELTSMLLQEVHNSIQDDMVLRAPETIREEGAKVVGLSHIDRANLNFIKTGSVGKVELPKISYRITSNHSLKQPHPITLLQSKTKQKGKRKQNEFERLRKHFEDKLRI